MEASYPLKNKLYSMKIQIDDKEFELLISYEQIKKRIRFIGIQLNVDFENRVPVFIDVLHGKYLLDFVLIPCNPGHSLLQNRSVSQSLHN